MKNNALLQHLCAQVAKLEDINAKLNEELTKVDADKALICEVFDADCWEQFVENVCQ